MAHPYTTFSAISDEFPTIDDTDWGVGLAPMQSTVADWIEEADQVIDAHLEIRFLCPLDAPPPIIGQISRDLVVARIRARIFSAQAEADPESVRIRNDAMKLLKSIQSGEVHLNAAGVAEAATTAGDDSRPMASWETDTDAATATFTMEQEW